MKPLRPRQPVRTVAFGARRGVSVRIGSARPAASAAEPAGVVIVGICPPDSPWLADLYPRAVVRDTRFRDPNCAVEHVRLSSRDAVVGLPGLEMKNRSRLRDAVRLALSVGAPKVDLLLARVAGAAPWELDRVEVAETLDSFLDLVPGAVIVMPDIGGPSEVGPGTHVPVEERVQRVVRTVRRYSASWVERYQCALVDCPRELGDHEVELFRGLLGSDAALCRWRGGPDPLRQHGWRSAAAVVGGMLVAQGDDIGLSLVGRSVSLPSGRAIARHRTPSLLLEGRTGPMLREEDQDTYMDLLIDGHSNRVSVLAEPTFRQPVGNWPVSALRAVKAIHKKLMEASERFVFENAEEAQAIALGVALRRSIRDFVDRGLLIGPEGKDEPEITGEPDRTPGRPSLVAVIDARLRPWSQKVSVRLSLRPGNRPVLEAS